MAFDEFFYKTNSNCFSTRFDLTNFFMIKYVSTYFETDWKRLRESNSIVPLPSVFSKFQKCQQISVGQSEFQKKMYKYSLLIRYVHILFRNNSRSFKLLVNLTSWRQNVPKKWIIIFWRWGHWREVQKSEFKSKFCCSLHDWSRNNEWNKVSHAF